MLVFEHNFDLNLDEVPLCININDKTFKLLYCSIYDSHLEHFRSIFILNSKYYLIDDLKENISLSIPVDVNIGKIFYYLS